MINGSRTQFGPLVLALLLCPSADGSPTKRVTPGELRQELSSLNAAHKSDKAQAEKLSTQQLTQRLNSSAARELISEAPGEQTRQQLQVLWDASAFLDPPAEEIPAGPTPDLAAQKAMLAKAIHYVAKSMPTLPNFLATRRTQRFEIVPQVAASASHDAGQITTSMQSNDRFAVAEELKDQRFEYRGLGVTSVAFRDGRETDDPSLTKAAEKGASRDDGISARRMRHGKPGTAQEGAYPGLVSWGEYGPILGIVLVDAAKSKVSWAGWERYEGKTAAVFSVVVGRAVSHYVVHQLAGHQAGNTPGTAGNGSGNPSEEHQSAYHARLTLDPETGTILRIAIQSDPAPDDNIRRGDLLVEYGPVQIGEKTYTCPIHSVALARSRNQLQLVAHGTPYQVLESELNDVQFTDYRRFGSEATMLTGNGEDSHPGQELAPEARPNLAEQVGKGQADVQVSESQQSDSNGISAKTDAASPGSELRSGAASVGEAGQQPVHDLGLDAGKVVLNQQEEEVLLHSVSEMPGMAEAPAGGGPASNEPGLVPQLTKGTFSLQATTRLVDVSLIAVNKHGKPVDDLREDQIELYDNGLRQSIHGFRRVKPGAAVRTESSGPADSFSNAIPEMNIGEPGDTVILLLDESHLSFLDLGRARKEIMAFLSANKPQARVALYSLNEHGFQILEEPSFDLARVSRRLASWVPSASAVAKAQSLEVRNRQQIDTVRSESDLNSVNGANVESPDYITSIDPQLRKLGDNPLQSALSSMLSLARHFGPTPGRKSLVWISGDSALVNWDDRAIGIDKSANDLSAALGSTREALNEAHMSLYAVNASSLGVGGAAVDPSLYNANVGLNPTDTVNSAPPGFGPPRNSTDGRATAQMQQDTRPIQGTVRLLAESTGGRAVNRGSDLKATLDRILSDSSEFYELAFTPDQPADGKLHSLQIKSSRKDIQLRYRSEYLYSKDAPDTRQRLQQTIWAAEDSSGITLSAEPVAGRPDKPGIEVRIGFKGLQLEPKGERWTDELYIFLAERDDARQQAKVDGDTMRLSLTKSSYDSGIQAGIPYRHDLLSLPRLGSVRVIVIDGNSGRMGTVTVPTSAFRP